MQPPITIFASIFFYDIYDSPYPAAFHRISHEHKEAAGYIPPHMPPLSLGHERTLPPEPSIHIIVHSELQPGSTSIMHIGMMEVDPSDQTASVAVKIVFSKDEKS
jgi:hypothetical protein